MAEHPPYRLAAVILAAGKSSRMGRPKLLLPWQNTTFAGHLLHQWRAVGVECLAVVCAADDAALSTELERLGLPSGLRIPNPTPETGMFGSIQCAASWPQWPAGVTHFAVALGDQPHLRLNTLRQLIAFSALNSVRVCQPSFEGHPRHPVVLPQPIFATIARSKAPTLKAFLALHAVAYCEIPDPGLAWDLDTPDDYARVLAACQAAGNDS